MTIDPLESLLRDVDVAFGTGPVQDGELPGRIRQLAHRRRRRNVALGGLTATVLLFAVAVAYSPGRHDERRIAGSSGQAEGTNHAVYQPGVTTDLLDGAQEGPDESMGEVEDGNPIVILRRILDTPPDDEKSVDTGSMPQAGGEEGPDESTGEVEDGNPIVNLRPVLGAPEAGKTVDTGSELQPGPDKPSKEPQVNPEELIKLLDTARDASAQQKLAALARTEAGQRLLFRSYLDTFLSLDKKGVLNLNVRVGRNQPGADIEYECWGVMFVDAHRKAYVGIEKTWHHKDGKGGMHGGGSWEKAGGLHTRLQRIQNLLGTAGAKGLQDKRLPRLQFAFVRPDSDPSVENSGPVCEADETVAYVCLLTPVDKASSDVSR